MKRILVTGAAGFIGHNLVSHYLGLGGYDVTGVDVVESPFADAEDSPNWIVADLVREATLLFDAIGVSYDLVFHCAGSASVGFSIEWPTIDFERNTVALQNVLWELERRSFSGVFVFLSSAAVYGDQETSELRESMTPKPISPYALNKTLCETVCAYFQDVKQFDVRIVRIFSAYGPGLRKQIFWDLHRKLVEKNEISLFGTGAEGRDYIHINDIISALELVAESGESGIYNLGNGVPVTAAEIAWIYKNHYGLTEEQIFFSGNKKEGDPAVLVANNEKIRSLGYCQSVDITSGVTDYLRWAAKQ